MDIESKRAIIKAALVAATVGMATSMSEIASGSNNHSSVASDNALATSPAPPWGEHSGPHWMEVGPISRHTHSSDRAFWG